MPRWDGETRPPKSRKGSWGEPFGLTPEEPPPFPSEIAASCPLCLRLIRTHGVGGKKSALRVYDKHRNNMARWCPGSGLPIELSPTILPKKIEAAILSGDGKKPVPKPVRKPNYRGYLKPLMVTIRPDQYHYLQRLALEMAALQRRSPSLSRALRYVLDYAMDRWPVDEGTEMAAALFKAFAGQDVRMRKSREVNWGKQKPGRKTAADMLAEQVAFVKVIGDQAREKLKGVSLRPRDAEKAGAQKANPYKDSR